MVDAGEIQWLLKNVSNYRFESCPDYKVVIKRRHLDLLPCVIRLSFGGLVLDYRSQLFYSQVVK